MRKEAIYQMTVSALMVALILVLGMTPLGLIPLGFINVTILCVPVIVGALALGPQVGLGLGACFGLTSALSAFGLSLVPPSGLASALVAASPPLAIIMCFVPRLLVPLSANAVYRLIARGKAQSPAALPIAAIVGSLTNTVLYLGLMLLFFYWMGLDSAAVLGVIAGTGLIAGGSEAAVAAIIATPVVIALWKIRKK